MVEARRADELDPLSVNMKWNAGYILSIARRHDEAIPHLQDTLELDPNYAWAHWTLGLAYTSKSMFTEGTDSLKRAVALSKSSSFLAWLGWAYARSGNTAQAQELLRDLIRLQTQRYVSPAPVALIYVAFGEKDQAFEWLEKAYQERSNMAYLGVTDHVDPLRSDPRFQDLLRRIGLEEMNSRHHLACLKRNP